MAPKIPKKLTRPIRETRFRTKILKRIYLERDRQFVETSFVTAGEGVVQLREDLSPEERARVGSIYKDIRKNRGQLRTGRLAVIAIIIGGAVLFSVVFKDRVLENAAERLLETTFQARSEVDGLRFKPLSGSVRIDAVTVANKDRPMQNLFQLGETELALRTTELLKGNVIVSYLGATGIAFGTPRETSGALLPSSKERDRKGKKKNETSLTGDGAVIARAQSSGMAVLEELGLSVGNLDPQQILDDAIGELESVRLIGELTTEAEESKNTIAEVVDAAASRVDRIQVRATTLAAQNVPKITDVESARSLYREVTGEVEAIQQMYRETADDIERVQNEVARVRELERVLRDAIATDIAAIGARIPDLSIDPEEFALGLVRTFLADFLGTAYDRGTVVLQHLQQLQRLRDEQEPRQKGPRRGGVDIAYPSVRYPRFAVTEATADSGENLAITITGVSSDPDLTDTPIVLTYRQGGKSPLFLDATVDLRTTRTELAQYSVMLPAVAATLPPAAASIGFDSLDGTGALEMSGTLGGTLDGVLRYTLRDPLLTPTKSAGAVATVLAETVNSTDHLDAEAAFQIGRGGLTRFSATTTLVDALRVRMDSLVAGARTAAEERLRAELENRLAGFLGPYEEYLGVIESLSDRSLAELARGETYTSLAEEQRKKIEAQVKEFTGTLEDQVRAEAQAKAAELEAQAAAARAEAQRKAEEAKAAARAAAEEEVRKRLPVPRFGN